MSISIERIGNSEPIIAPTENPWETSCTANSCALLLDRCESTDRIISNIIGAEAMKDPRLKDGVVVSLYTGVGKMPNDTRFRQNRGLAVFSPELELIKRLNYPVLCTSANPNDIDSVGVEDVRLTRINGRFYGWYCGYNGKEGAACVTFSDDLLHWTKVAPLPGNINNTYNKDHVIFEQKILGRWLLLHRPWGPKYPDPYDMVIRLAFSDNILGPWQDIGEIIRAFQHPQRLNMWVGAGPPPIPLRNNKFLLIYHTGSRFNDGYRQYDACAAILDFNLFSYKNLKAIVVKRLEPLMVPNTEWEKNSKLRIDIVFPMGAYIYGKDLMIVYGAGDKFTCAAKMPFNEVMDALEKSSLENPYIN